MLDLVKSVLLVRVVLEPAYTTFITTYCADVSSVQRMGVSPREEVYHHMAGGMTTRGITPAEWGGAY